MTTETAFNSAPIMLQPPTKQQLPSSLTMNQPTEEDILANMIYHIDVSSSYHDQPDDFDDAMMMMPVPQHLDSEQINYEFPPKSHLKALAYLDQLEQEYSFFDETSFTSLSNDSSSSASSMSFLSGYFDEQHQGNSSATTPLRHDYISSASHLFSSLIDENDEDLDFTHTHSHHDYHMTQVQSSKAASAAAAASTTTTALVDDNRLSPLQLPAQAHHYSYHHQREQSCDSTKTITKNLIVAPQSFLSMPSTTPLYKSNNNSNYDNNGKRADLSALVHSSTCSVTQTESYIHSRFNSLSSVDLPIIISETEPILDQDDDDNDEDRDSMTSDYLYSPQHQQHVVLIKISKLSKTHQQRQQDRCPTSLTYLGSDEGYDDEDLDGKLSFGPEIESASVFLPLEDEEGYGGNSSTDKTHSAWTHFQQQQQQWTRRIQYLEQQLDEERAMRQAFEKAMEDMTVLMDQQQNVLYDRLEQEISMRQVYEHKVQQTAALVQPLEARLEKETTARIQLEGTMAHVLDQLQLLQSQHQQHLTDDATQRKHMQKKLDKALDDISELSTRASSTTTNNNNSSTIVSSRPSKVPSSANNSNVTLSPSSKSTKNVIKPSARPPTTTTTATKQTTTIINRSKQASIVPSSSRRTKLPNNGSKRLTTAPTVKSGLESLKQSPSASKRLASHR